MGGTEVAEENGTEGRKDRKEGGEGKNCRERICIGSCGVQELEYFEIIYVYV